MGFTREFLKEWRIGDYGRLRKYSLWDQETSEISPKSDRLLGEAFALARGAEAAGNVHFGVLPGRTSRSSFANQQHALIGGSAAEAVAPDPERPLGLDPMLSVNGSGPGAAVDRRADSRTSVSGSISTSRCVSENAIAPAERMGRACDQIPPLRLNKASMMRHSATRPPRH